MTIDDYFAAIERSLKQNLQNGVIDEPLDCLASTIASTQHDLRYDAH
jgi:hypothetical protein